ncbi:uncharacterized protein PAF06_007389 [Gastrophryne carolinensis]
MIPIDPVTILLSIVVILFFTNLYNNQKQNKYKNFPPGPRPLPIIGNMHILNLNKPHTTIIELSKTYGPVLSVQVGMQKMVALCGYDTIKDALINHAEEFSDRPRSPMFSKTIRDYGVVFSNGENWKVMRRFTLSTLRDYGMGKKSIEDKISEETECLIEAFRLQGGKPFNYQVIINAAVANIIVSILLSRRFDYEDSTLQKLMSLVNENIRLLGSPIVRLYNSFPLLLGMIPGNHKKISGNNLKMQSFIRETFTKQRKELDVNDQRNLIDTFLAKQQEGKPESNQYFHDENLTALVTNLFAAGMETTSTTLRWGLLLMMKYPEIQKKVQEEIDRVIGTAQPRFEHRKQMPYTDAVIHEIQRFGDIAPGSVPHATSQDVNFRGYSIPKGTIVIPLLSSSLKDEAYFKKPYKFYPEHFLDAEGNFKKNEAFIPFSIGKRSCAGETLARMELFLFFTALLQAFRFQPAPGAVLDLTPALGSTNSPLPHEICAIDRLHYIYINYCLIFSNGENWKVMRRFVLSALRDYGMGKKSIEDKILEETEFLIETFRSYGGRPFNNQIITNAAVANIIVSVLLSRRFEYEDPTVKKLMSLVNENVRLAASPIVRVCVKGCVSNQSLCAEKLLTALLRGTTVIPVLSSSLKDENYFTKPFEFYPEHFLDAQGNLKKNEAFIPFSIGKRSCAGETLAKMELFLFFTSLLQAFRFQAPPGAELHLTSTPGITIMFCKTVDEKNSMNSHRGKVRHTVTREKVTQEVRDNPWRVKDYREPVLVFFYLKLGLNCFAFAQPSWRVLTPPYIAGAGVWRGIREKIELIKPQTRENICPLSKALQPLMTNYYLYVVMILLLLKYVPSSSTKSYFIGYVKEIVDITEITMDPVTVLVSVVVILFFATMYNNQKQDKYKNFPPGPKPLPIIGNVLKLNMNKPHKTFIELSKTYGSILSVQIGMEKMVVLCGYDTIKDALINHAEEFSDRPETPLFAKTTKGHGLIFSNGENWKVMRRFALSTLRDFGMGKKSIEDKIIEETGFLIETFRSYSGKPFNNQTIINAAVANIIVAILLSRRFEYEDPTIKKLMSLVNENVRLLGSPIVRLYNSFPLLLDLIPGGHQKIGKNVFEMQSFIRETFSTQKKELDVNDQRNLIDAFLAKQQEGKPESTQYFHDENLTALVANLFGAGMETTSTTLRWGLLLMMKYPEIQKKVHEEIDRVIGTAQPRQEHRKQMPYTDAVIHEIQRFGDIAPASLPHATSQDVTFRGYFIPKGTTVIPVLSSVLNDETHFKKQHEFYPEHFLDAQGNFKKNEALIPFSIGKRSCAGETLAKMELFLFFTALLQAFRFQAPSGDMLDLTPALGATNSPLPHDICAIDRT